MTQELKRPGRKNPLSRTHLPLLPPDVRSVPSLGLLPGAAEGRFALQKCTGCGTFIYPVRDVCPNCLGQNLIFDDAPRGGELLAATVIDITADPYYRQRPPMRQGLVKSDAGVEMVAILHGDCPDTGRVRLSLKLDRAGNAVVFAHPETGGGPNAEDDPAWRELTAQPKYRRVLITDARSPVTIPLVKEFQKAGADEIRVGVAERWKPSPMIDALEAMDGVMLVDLNLRDERSVKDLASDIGGKTEILVHNAFHFRPGRMFETGQVLRAKDALDISALGFMRLAHFFGPALAGRGADGVRSGAAWVNVLSIWAQSGRPAYAAYSAAQAAELSLAQSLRGEMAQGGVRVMNIFTGAIEDPWFESLPPPKTAPAAIAKGILKALNEGLEDLYIGPEAQDFQQRMARNPKEIERLMWRE
ncbi:SDR family oxidoreductase [Celeribacter sp.]|uniref:SDR family oxidoreductase n=1 Tax=Celeribacter sp. TaxID=1890673 RepID=UPI003A953834